MKIIKKTIQRIDLTICFQKATQNAKSIDFYLFSEVLRALQAKMGFGGSLSEFIQ